MDHRIRQLNYHPLAQINQPVKKPLDPNRTSFKDLLDTLQTEQSSLKISKHAEKRLNERNIHIDQELWQRIEQKVNEAKVKGVHDSLVVTDQAALIVSAKNNTVITAMDRQEASSQIFTNINGTILM
ncbi:TIGR02530 family flagellar biosynthesis protein [Calidifontibacillus oryziterrae]|uniref:TIGR02530 family flagellar biosynthesis protein n=1 Tax=Calidifontibacillus oryziterrae TaxID=1191699 RepID=UPI0002D9D519|nr:TIGR02530 family flagellar biosynthesis protein [Calidifontibacillus oryziterrae]